MTAVSTPEVTAPAEAHGRTRIRAAALELFAARGVAGTSMRAVAARAGVSLGLVVHHFGSKEALAAEVDREVVARFDAALSASGDSLTLELPSVLAGAVTGVSTTGPEFRDYLRRTLLEAGPAGSSVFASLLEVVRRHLRRLDEMGLVRPDADPMWLAPQILMVIIAPTLLGPLLAPAVGDLYSEESVRRRTAANLDLLFRGLLLDPRTTGALA
jgi:AcrR family transcriptional regulator